MKINIKNFIVALVACSAIVWTACGDKATLESAVIAPDGPRVKFLHAISNRATDVTAFSQPFVVFANENKWTAVLNTLPNGADSINYGFTFPSVDYSVFPAGSINFKVKLPRSLNPDTTVLAAALDLKAGKYYTVMAADTFPSAKLIAIEDDRSVNKNVLKSYYRVVNAVSGSPAAGFDVYMRRQSTTGALATVKFGEASPFFEIDPNTSTVNDTMFIRPNGLATNFVVINHLTTTFTANRIRTIVIRGNALPGTRGVRTGTVTTIINN